MLKNTFLSSLTSHTFQYKQTSKRSYANYLKRKRPAKKDHSPVLFRSFLNPLTCNLSQEGEMYTKDYKLKVQVNDSESVNSFWHDIPLISGQTENRDVLYNFVCEIPRLESYKLEMDKAQPGNPIVHDLKDGDLRITNYHPYLWNYGYLPQTWEDPSVEDPRTGLLGDGDPIDVIEIGRFTYQTGDVVPVKIIGALKMIDDGETDWKILAISHNDPHLSVINTPEDLDTFKPGMKESIVNFLINYKVNDGKAPNQVDSKVIPANEAIEIVNETHVAWEELVQGKRTNSHGYELSKQ
eukprot:TRINITY_DN3536_c0_g1_i1.p1 TRINITY_DN3536_c0_g1~~TRINITY_DN3536_c0_g1_i1.p1  ORF type:complete len:296 (+),score=83.52 TRINITY_DN3536_c0_g1_i1:37-924(+)